MKRMIFTALVVVWAAAVQLSANLFVYQPGKNAPADTQESGGGAQSDENAPKQWKSNGMMISMPANADELTGYLDEQGSGWNSAPAMTEPDNVFLFGIGMLIMIGLLLKRSA